MKSFNARVYALVKRIPCGRVLSYGRVAALLDAPHGARAVGWALHGLVHSADRTVPWYRVVNAQGRISLPGEGGEEQRRRLMAEGVEFDKQDLMKLEKFNAIMWQISPLEAEFLLQGDNE